MKDDVGRGADTPTDLPSQGWKQIAQRVMTGLREDNVSLSAAGVAFFGFLALIPALAAVLSIYGIVADPQEAARRMEDLFGALPSEARGLLTQQVRSIAESSSGALSITLVVSVLVSVWSASSGIAHLVDAVNSVYDEHDDRTFVARRGLALLLTLGATVAVVATIFAITVLPGILADVLPGALGWLVTAATWALIGVLFVVGLAVLFRVGPDRDSPEWRWVTPGALVALAAWVVGSAVFSIYVSHFGSYGETYGSLGAVVVLLLWLFLSAFVVLLAGEINAEMEHQTAQDTTVGADRRMGSRDAQMADQLP